MVSGEGFWQTIRPDARSTIRDRFQFQAIVTDLLEGLAKLLGAAFVPLQVDVNAHQLFFLVGARSGLLNSLLFMVSFGITYRFQCLRALAKARDNSLSEFF